MEDTKALFNKKKYTAIILMAVAFLFLCMNWFKLGSETRNEIEEYKEEMEESMEYAMSVSDVDDLEEYFDEEGYSSKEVKKMVAAVEAMFDLLDKGEEGKGSVFTLMSVNSDLSAMKPAMSEPDLVGSDAEEMSMTITVVRVILYVIIAVFLINMVLMLFTIFCYVTERKSYGVISAILSGIMFVGLGGFM